MRQSEGQKERKGEIRKKKKKMITGWNDDKEEAGQVIHSPRGSSWLDILPFNAGQFFPFLCHFFPFVVDASVQVKLFSSPFFFPFFFHETQNTGEIIRPGQGTKGKGRRKKKNEWKKAEDRNCERN